MIKRDRKVNPRAEKVLKLGKSFENALLTIINGAWNHDTGKNYVTDYLKALDAKSTETFNHSVNVAAHVYNEMTSWKNENGEPMFTRGEVLSYTRAALLHDVGKLTTDIDVLHSNASLRGEKGNPEAWKIMMGHSIDGLKLAKQMGFEKEDIFISLAHHVDSTSLDAGPSGGFANATISRGPWEAMYGEGGVEKMLMENCSWVGEKDILAAKIVHFCDVVEAVRSNERRYQLQHDWNMSQSSENAKRVDPAFAGNKGVRYSIMESKAAPLPENFVGRNHGGSVADIVRANTGVPNIKRDARRYEVGARELDPIFDRTPDKEAIKALENKELLEEEKKVLSNRVKETTDRWKSYCREFDAIQNLGASSFARECVATYSKETVVEVSIDKLEDMRKDPSCGIELMEKRKTSKGSEYYILEDERMGKPIVHILKGADASKEQMEDAYDLLSSMRGHSPSSLDDGFFESAKVTSKEDSVLEELEDDMMLG